MSRKFTCGDSYTYYLPSIIEPNYEYNWIIVSKIEGSDDKKQKILKKEKDMQKSYQSYYSLYVEKRENFVTLYWLDNRIDGMELYLVKRWKGDSTYNYLSNVLFRNIKIIFHELIEVDGIYFK